MTYWSSPSGASRRLAPPASEGGTARIQEPQLRELTLELFCRGRIEGGCDLGDEAVGKDLAGRLESPANDLGGQHLTEPGRQVFGHLWSPHLGLVGAKAQDGVE